MISVNSFRIFWVWSTITTVTASVNCEMIKNDMKPILTYNTTVQSVGSVVRQNQVLTHLIWEQRPSMIFDALNVFKTVVTDWLRKFISFCDVTYKETDTHTSSPVSFVSVVFPSSFSTLSKGGLPLKASVNISWIRFLRLLFLLLKQFKDPGRCFMPRIFASSYRFYLDN